MSQSLIDHGLRLVFEGKFEEARVAFKKAHREAQSAESLTYWGWMEYQLGNVEKAIRLCRKAIRRDPELGNPYNDIGSYLVVLGREEEAIEWFEKAIAAPKYEARHYPHLNLGRLFMKRRLPIRALQEFQKADTLSPGDSGVEAAIKSLIESLN